MVAYPEADTTRLTFTTVKPERFTVRLRYPAWAQDGIFVTVNGVQEEITAKPGSYVAVDRTWKTGDVLELRLPMRLHIEPLPNHPEYVAVMHGPIVLAGDLGREGLTHANRYGLWAPPGGRQPSDTVPPIVVPTFVGDVAGILAKIHPDATPLHSFHTTGLAQPHDVHLVPFWKLFAERYTVYWKLTSPEEWKRTNSSARP